jgi:hypothetical protein
MVTLSGGQVTRRALPLLMSLKKPTRERTLAVAMSYKKEGVT